MANEVIKLIHTVASIVNDDKDIQDKLKGLFLENYNVSLIEKIIPADLEPYIETQEYAESVYRDCFKWQQMSLLNIAHSSKFSSERTVQEYANDHWKIKPIY